MVWYSLDITDDTTFLEALQQIDQDSVIVGSGNPNTNEVVAGKVGVWYFDTAGNPGLQFWYAVETGTGSWSQLITVGSYLEAATSEEVSEATSNTVAVTPLSGGEVYATQGVNSDISQLTGLTTPLSATQGGTGINTLPTVNAVIQGNGSGHYISEPLNFAQLQGGCNLETQTNNILPASAGGVGLNSPGTAGKVPVSNGATYYSGELNNIAGAINLEEQVAYVLPPANGGTGVVGTDAANGQLLIGNGTGFTLGTLTAGAGIVIDNSSGAITISWNSASAFEGVLGIENGGTNLSTTPTDGQLLIGDSSTSDYDLGTVTAGAGIAVTNGHGSITIALTSEIIPIGNIGDLGIAENNTSGILEVNNGTSGTFGPITNCGIWMQSLGAQPWTSPTGLNVTVTQVGTPGSTNVFYQVSAVDASGLFVTQAAVGSTNTSQGSDANDSNYDVITWDLVAGAAAYNIYIDGSGYIGTSSSNSFNNTGITPDGDNIPPSSSTYGSILWATNGGGNIGTPQIEAWGAGPNSPYSIYATYAISGSTGQFFTVNLATPLSLASGGTGISSSPTSGQLLIGNAENGWSIESLDAGNGITITYSDSTLEISVDQSELALGSIGGQLGLTSQVTGTLPVANGGTGTTLFTSGTATFVSAGSVSVADTTITASSIIMVTQGGNGSALSETYDVEVTAGTGFTIYSSNAASTAIVKYIRIN